MPATPPANPWIPRLGLALGILLMLASLLAAWMQPVRPDTLEQPPTLGQAAWWLHPMERNPQLRLPRVSGDLADVFALPGTERVWAVGQKGLILHTEDGGLSWLQQHPAPASPPPAQPQAILPELITSAHAVEAPVQRTLPEPPTDLKAEVIEPIQQNAPPVVVPAPNNVKPPSIADLEAEKKRMLAEELKKQTPWQPSARTPVPPTIKPPIQQPPKATPEPPPSTTPQAVPQVSPPVSPLIPPDADLLAVHFNDASTGWAASAQGIALITRNGGQGWTPPANADELKALFPEADRQRQARLKPDQPYALPIVPDIKATLLAMAEADIQRRWAVGQDGVIIASHDGGKTWHRQTRAAAPPDADKTPGTYARLPAPWTYVVFLMGVGLVLRASQQMGQRRQLEAQPQMGIAGLFVSDHPLGPGDPDPLGHGLVAEGLANFILNRNTEPGITMAVTGPWGSGKSSIMRLLLYRLEEAGFRPAWFNAWHHQQEGRQLASLFNTIRRQAVPSLYTPAAWRVRAALFWNRGWFYRLLFLGVLALVLLGGFEAFRDFDALRQTVVSTLTDTRKVVITSTSLAKLKEDKALDAKVLDVMANNMLWRQQTASDKKADDPQSKDTGACLAANQDCAFKDMAQLQASLEALIKPRKLTDEEIAAIQAAAQHLGTGPQSILAVLLGALVVPLLLGKGLAVYGLNYLDIFKRLLPDRARPEGKEAVGTMENLRTEFALLTEALDGRLVLFIDDLDRCSCQTVREVLELVNYLASVGQCFIVLGMAMEHVACCIEPKTEDQDRREYALQYLKKLINIEVPVPVMDPDHSREMLESQTGATERPTPPTPWRRWLGWGLGLAGVLALSWGLPQAWRQLQPQAEPKAFISATAPASQAGIPRPQTTTTPNASSTPATVGLEPPTLPGQSWLLALLPAAVLLGLAFWLTRAYWLDWLHTKGLLPALRRALGQARRGDDKPEFGAALLDWHEVILQGDPTPRGVKRFVNRVRFLAMMEQSQPQADRISDALLVALAALHHARLSPDGGGDAHAMEAMDKTPDWPPGEEQLERFERLMWQLHIR
jgi:hypothetical protein